MQVVFTTSTLKDGPMGRTKTLSEAEYARRVDFARKEFGSEALEPVMVDSAHGSHIHAATLADAGLSIPNCDGLFTTEANLPLMVTHQDCVPIVLFDEKMTFVAVLHAGWRGVVAQILPKALEFALRYAAVDQLRLSFGPAIGPCHFEVEKDVADEFLKISTGSVIERDGKFFVDLRQALTVQAEKLGINQAQIETSADCTFHDDRYPSWRRDGKREANMVTVAMLRA